jgi:acetylornithine deacetylase/succinyl-diaminopimelate desuccinylase-like protein
MKKILGGLAAFLLLLAAILVVHASMLRSRQVEARPVTDLQVDARAAAEHLAAALRFRTVSRPDGLPAEPAQMAGLDGYLDQSFPRVHAALSREVVNGYSLLYTWRGADPALAPVLLLSHIAGATAESYAFLAPELPFGPRVFLGNLWLFEPLAVRVLEASPASNATLRTTTAVTIIQAGVKDNVLPPEARAVVNFRILPGDSIDAVEAHVRRTIADRRVLANRYGPTASEPSAESPTAAPGFQLLARTLREVAPGVVVAPNLLSGATDSRHYATVLGILPYRFVPMRLGAADLARIHGTDERLGVANFAEIVRFYAQLLRNGAS